jgi:Rrf2 family cysteine metabolism transcriptional repressor
VQILLQLKAAGLVMSTRGAAGGYQLARPPERISLADVIHVIDPPASPRFDAALSPSRLVQTLRGVWLEVQGEEQRMLDEITLTDLLRKTEQTNALSYQI